MAYDNSGIHFGQATAAADLSAKQFFAVKVTAANVVNLAGAGDGPIGVLQNKPTSGQAADVLVFGMTKASAGAAIAAGAKVMVDSNGQFQTASGSAKYYVGTAVTAASALNDVFVLAFGVGVGHLSP